MVDVCRGCCRDHDSHGCDRGNCHVPGPAPWRGCHAVNCLIFCASHNDDCFENSHREAKVVNSSVLIDSHCAGSCMRLIALEPSAGLVNASHHLYKCSMSTSNDLNLPRRSRFTTTGSMCPSSGDINGGFRKRVINISSHPLESCTGSAPSIIAKLSLHQASDNRRA